MRADYRMRSVLQTTVPPSVQQASMTPVQVNAAGWTRPGFLGRHRPLDTYPRDWYREVAEAGIHSEKT